MNFDKDYLQSKQFSALKFVFFLNCNYFHKHKYSQIRNTLKDIQQISHGFLPNTLKTKYLSLGEMIADNLEQETINQFQFPKK